MNLAIASTSGYTTFFVFSNLLSSEGHKSVFFVFIKTLTATSYFEVWGQTITCSTVNTLIHKEKISNAH